MLPKDPNYYPPPNRKSDTSYWLKVLGVEYSYRHLGYPEFAYSAPVVRESWDTPAQDTKLPHPQEYLYRPPGSPHKYEGPVWPQEYYYRPLGGQDYYTRAYKGFQNYIFGITRRLRRQTNAQKIRKRKQNRIPPIVPFTKVERY